MNRTRYCSTCRALLSAGAAICGECGARYQESPYERRATDAPAAWFQRPLTMRRDDPRQQELTREPADEIELISRKSMLPGEPGTTALRPAEQYDQMMVTQSPMLQRAPGAPTGQPGGPGSPAPSSDVQADGASSTGELEAPLDGCVPAAPAKRVAAALIDGVIFGVLTVPLLIGIILLARQDPVSMLAAILTGLGVALPVAYALVMIWLTGSKGFSLGKLASGLRITRRSDGGGIGVLRALGRGALYGVLTWLIGLTVFLDPRKQLRGFHDRAVGSVVVDIRAGRDPMVPRADYFERPADTQYLGAASLEVSAHDNLLTEPGAAWRDSPAPETPLAGPAWSAPFAPVPVAQSAPHEPVGDAWARPADDIVAPACPSAAVEPDEDLEQSRSPWARTPVATKLRLTTDDGASSIVGAAVVVGRNPSGEQHEETVVLKDETRSVSKTHLRIDASGDDLVVTDLGSTNGSTILGEDGSHEDLVPHESAVVPAGTTLALGDRTLTVEEEQ
ncbi:RDD family protein [Brachybacterium alimentarium]|uniref:RDD family protein n=1 Tax=Brachybacterium alimentarium TaxID=47845 RepID=UPI003FCF4999